MVAAGARGRGRQCARRCRLRDVIARHVDSPKVDRRDGREARHQERVGHNADQSAPAPKGLVTGAELKWGTVYTAYADLPRQGARSCRTRTTAAMTATWCSRRRSDRAPPIAAKAAALAAIEDLKAGKPYFIGPIKSNTGKLISAETIELYDPSLWGTDYLIEGVTGSITRDARLPQGNPLGLLAFRGRETAAPFFTSPRRERSTAKPAGEGCGAAGEVTPLTRTCLVRPLPMGAVKRAPRARRYAPSPSASPSCCRASRAASASPSAS